MALWPSFRRDLVGFCPTNLYKIGWLNQHAAATNTRLTAFGVFTESASWPEGAFPAAPTRIAPIVAGGMGGRAYGEFTGTASLLQGGPMTAPATMAITMGTPSMSLTVGMTAPWTGAYTPSANLRMTVGMEATYTAAFTGASNLAMIVPLGNTTFTAAFTGSADLKGDLSMTASFGGAEPLSPEGLARAVWEALAADYNTAGTMGEKLNGAGSAGNPWTEVIEGTYTAAQVMRIMSAALAGKTSGQKTAPVFRNITDTANAITATVDANGNRTAVTLNP